MRLELGIPIILCTAYVPPSAPVNYMESLCSYIAELVEKNENVVVVGDFNLPDVDWNTIQGSSPCADKFCETIFECNLTQLANISANSQQGECAGLGTY